MKNRFNLKDELVALVDKFKSFFKRIWIFAFFWGRFALISYGAAILIPVWLRKLGLNFSASILLARILLSIAPLFPTLFYSHIEQDDRFNEFSSDLSFVAWSITLVYAWCILMK